MQTSASNSSGQNSRIHAFTLVELLVIVAVLALLALCILPALARTKPDTRALQCLNNHRQLSRAWGLYSDDNNERFIGIPHGTGIMSNDPRAPWVQGWLTWDTRNDNTNTILVSDPRFASIANYCGREVRQFKCPADQFLSSIQRSLGWKQRVRSVSGNIYVGGVNVEFGPIDTAFAVARKWSDLSNPKPAETWVFIDEHPDSINDQAFFTPRINEWIDLPGNLHDGGTGVAYADGSAEIHRWEGGVLNRRVTLANFSSWPVVNDPDIAWLRYRTPRKPGAN